MGSSAADAKDALVTVLQARTALSAVTISREYPSKAADLKSGSDWEAIWIGRDGDQNVSGTAAFPHLGHQVIDETYTVWVTVQVFKVSSGGTQADASERAYALADEIVDAVLDDPRLGLADTSARSMFHIGLSGTGYEFEEITGRLKDGGNACQVRVGLICTARIHRTT